MTPNETHSDYRLYDNDKLPSEYVKSEKFDSQKFIEENFVSIDGKLVHKTHCPICGEPASGKVCLNCYGNLRDSRIPSREELIKDLMSNQSILALSKRYGVSDNAYRKWLIKR